MSDNPTSRQPAIRRVEIYTPARVAEFLLSNAVDAKDYRAAVQAVRKLGVDPRTIAHARPGRR
jgi:hypothetical protein